LVAISLQIYAPLTFRKKLKYGIALNYRIKMSAYLVKHYMSEEVPTIESHISVVEAAKEMRKIGRGFLIILKEGQPAGIVTEHDFVDKVIADELNPAKVSVGEIMSSPLITIDPDEDLVKASEIMKMNKIRRLPVVKEGIMYGVLTSRDISQRFVEYLDKSSRDIMRWCAIIG